MNDVVRTSALKAASTWLLGGLVMGALTGGLGYAAVVDGGWRLLGFLLGALFIGPIVGLLAGTVAAIAVIVAAKMQPRTTLHAARARDRNIAVVVTTATGLAVAVWWYTQIDLEDGRRIWELILPVVVAPIATSIWVKISGLRYLSGPDPRKVVSG